MLPFISDLLLTAEEDWTHEFIVFCGCCHRCCWVYVLLFYFLDLIDRSFGQFHKSDRKVDRHVSNTIWSSRNKSRLLALNRCVYVTVQLQQSHVLRALQRKWFFLMAAKQVNASKHGMVFTRALQHSILQTVDCWPRLHSELCVWAMRILWLKSLSSGCLKDLNMFLSLNDEWLLFRPNSWWPKADKRHTSSLGWPILVSVVWLHLVVWRVMRNDIYE